MSTGHSPLRYVSLSSSTPHLLKTSLLSEGALGSLTKCLHFVDLLKAFRKPRAGALGSLTECPLDIRPFGYVSSPSSTPQLLKTSLLSAGALGSLTECQHFVDVLWAFRKPRAGALGSLTECPLDIRPFGYVSSSLIPMNRPRAGGGIIWNLRIWNLSTGHSPLRVRELILLNSSTPQNLLPIKRGARFAHRMSTGHSPLRGL